MDSTKQNQIRSSANTRSKSGKTALSYIIFVGLLFSIGFGCSSTSKKNDFAVSALKDNKEKDLFQLTFKGSNFQGSFHPVENKILFIGSKRETHNSGQVYELDLNQQKERRVTYNAGIDSFPQYHPKDDLMLYSSTTDAIKENIPLDKLKMSLGILDRMPQGGSVDLPPHDIYLSSLYGSKIRRLTSRYGFDGDARFVPDGKKIVFTSENDGQLTLKMLNLQTDTEEKLNVHFPNVRWPSVFYKEKEKQVLGIMDEKNSAKLVVQDLSKSKDVVFETADSAIYQQPSWHPTESKIVVSSNRLNQNNFDLFVFDLTTQCVQRITYSNALDQDPVFSPDGQKILFTSNRTGENQLFFIKYDASQPCENKVAGI